MSISRWEVRSAAVGSEPRVFGWGAGSRHAELGGVGAESGFVSASFRDAVATMSPWRS